MVIDRYFTHTGNLCHFLITHLMKEPQSEDLLAERWQFCLNESHQPFQTVIIIYGDDVVLQSLPQEDFFHLLS